MRMRKLDVHVRQYLFVPSAYPRLFDSRWVSCIASHRPVTVSFERTRIPSTKICDCCWYYTGISRDSWHKRRATGGKKTPLRKKRKFELGRAAANTKVHNNFVNFLYLLCMVELFQQGYSQDTSVHSVYYCLCFGNRYGTFNQHVFLPIAHINMV